MCSTSINKLVLSITLVVLMLFPLACSEKNTDAPDYNKVHTEDWYNPQYLSNTVFHGTEVKRQGTLSCSKCHEIYSEGQENIPGCFKCHFGPDGSREPVSSDWAHGLERHEAFPDDQAVCNSCHDVGRSFGTGPGICHDCHGSGETHALGQPWLDRALPDYHGNQSQEDCANCHTLSTDCYQCHFGTTGSKSPIGSGWLHRPGDEDHKDEDFEAHINICNSCHFLSRSYRGEPSSCHDCHDD